MSVMGGFANSSVRKYVSRSWPNPGTRGEQVRSMYDRLKEALSKETVTNEASAKEASLKESGAGGDEGKGMGSINGQVTAPK